ncbi:MAG: hypothetical protein KKG95_07635 [Candidatus Omnitrophica bacterium]|nr:hypothetical protein [Candidatus Omnitrophota bacterium]
MDTIRAKGQEIRSKRRVGKTGTKAQRHKGTKAQRGKGPGSRRIGRYGELCAKSSKTVLIKMVYELGRR